MAFVIRPARPPDIARLNAMIPEAVRALSSNFYTEQQIEGAIEDIFGVDTQLVDDGTYLIVTEGEQIAGCGGWSKRNTMYGGDQFKDAENDDLLNPATEPARIRAFFVHPQWARQGVGSMIMRACEDAARHEGFRALELVATLPGEPLYRYHGFHQLRRYTVSLTNGEMLPVVSMRKELR